MRVRCARDFFGHLTQPPPLSAHYPARCRSPHTVCPQDTHSAPPPLNPSLGTSSLAKPLGEVGVFLLTAHSCQVGLGLRCATASPSPRPGRAPRSRARTRCSRTGAPRPRLRPRLRRRSHRAQVTAEPCCRPPLTRTSFGGRPPLGRSTGGWRGRVRPVATPGRRPRRRRRCTVAGRPACARATGARTWPPALDRRRDRLFCFPSGRGECARLSVRG